MLSISIHPSGPVLLSHRTTELMSSIILVFFCKLQTGCGSVCPLYHKIDGALLPADFPISAEDSWSSVTVTVGYLLTSLTQLLGQESRHGPRHLLFHNYWGTCAPVNTQSFKNSCIALFWSVLHQNMLLWRSTESSGLFFMLTRSVNCGMLCIRVCRRWTLVKLWTQHSKAVNTLVLWVIESKWIEKRQFSSFEILSTTQSVQKVN